MGQPNAFEFYRSDVEGCDKVGSLPIPKNQMTLPDSYSGFGISIRYRVTAKCYCVFPVSSSCYINVKRHVVPCALFHF